MKLVRFGEPGKEIPGIVWEDNKILDVSDWVKDYDESFFGEEGINYLTKQISKTSNLKTMELNMRMGVPLLRPSKIICVGLNYRKHAIESGMDIPKEPVLFYKSTSALVGINDHVIIPKGSMKTDWEVELAMVIGKRASHVSKEQAMDYVSGFVMMNDISERAFQLEGTGQWLKGKGCDTFAPLGPFIATKDEIPDPHNLKLWLSVNGEMLQNSNTADLVFDLPTLVSYISNYMTLFPGDIISTGTPSGVGLGLKPPRFLKSGDVIELGIEGLGSGKELVKSFGS